MMGLKQWYQDRTDLKAEEDHVRADLKQWAASGYGKATPSVEYLYTTGRPETKKDSTEGETR